MRSIYIKAILVVPALLAVTLVIVGCASSAKPQVVPAVHPEELPTGRPDCLECHEDEGSPALKPYGSFAHTARFLREHGSYAAQTQELCAACHKADFCQACHATSEELKPSLRLGDRPDRPAPHRGDYLARHRIDGRLDPGSCVVCHGNRSAATCRRCHN